MLKEKLREYIKEMEQSLPYHLRMLASAIIPQALSAMEKQTDEELILLIRKLDDWIARRASELEDAYGFDKSNKN